MIVCERYRTLFFAVPRTASKAISQALREHLGGEEVKPMHLSYAEYASLAPAPPQNYFSFATVRNPLDSVVSAYWKKRSDHNGRFSRGTFRDGRPIAPRALAEYRFIHDRNADFAAYFLEFYREPYARPRHEGTLARVDHVLHYERLAEEYAALVKQRDWPEHQLPVTNATAGKARDFLASYTQETRERARYVFAGFMERWGYEFPADW